MIVSEGRLFRVITHYLLLTTHTSLTLVIVEQDAQLRQRIPHAIINQFRTHRVKVQWQDFCALILVRCSIPSNNYPLIFRTLPF